MGDAAETIQEREAADGSLARILVVEDDPLVRTVLNKALMGFGCRVDSVAGGDEASELITREVYDVVLSDVNLPGKKGMQLLRQCRQTSPHTEFILVTGEPSVDAAVASIKDGAYDYLSKPFKASELRKKVSAALQSSFKKKRTEQDTRTMPAVPDGMTIIRALGSGSMGLVLLVERDGHEYAMKILRTDLMGASRKDSIKRLYREASILEKVDHPNIVRIYDMGTTPSEQPFILMEYIDGRSLDDVASGASLTLKRKLSLMAQVANALTAVHQLGVLHRDIKPSNILITADYRALLTDFGVARFMDVHSSVTIPGSVVGSPAFMAPENFLAEELTCASDVFSLGIMLYELVTGHMPFEGGTLEDLVASLNSTRPKEPRVWVPNLPAVLCTLMMHMLERSREDRCQSAAHVAAVLNVVMAGMTTA